MAKAIAGTVARRSEECQCSPHSDGPCAMRADARRNQQRILDAAREQVSTIGTEVSMEQIARAAGVAVGTLYRHYPTKTDLLQAILTEHSAVILARAEEAMRSVVRRGDAAARIEKLLTELLAEAAANHAFKEAASALGAGTTTSEQQLRGRTAVESLLQAAQTDGDINPDVTADDIYLIMATAPASLDKASRDRWLQLILAGIKAS